MYDLNKIQSANAQKNRKLVLTAMFSAMSVIITTLNITIPFPILPYLKIDFAEIPVTIAFYMLGPIHGLITSTIYWIILTARAGNFLGPAMKYAAVLSMLIGYYVAKRVFNNYNSQKIVIMGLGFAIIVRVIVMSLVNYGVILFIAPYYLGFIKGLLSVAGLPYTSTSEIMMWTMIITAAYNMLHCLVSLVLGYMITEKVVKRLQLPQQR